MSDKVEARRRASQDYGVRFGFGFGLLFGAACYVVGGWLIVGVTALVLIVLSLILLFRDTSRYIAEELGLRARWWGLRIEDPERDS